MGFLNDKKAIAVDGLTVKFFKRIGLGSAYQMFLRWCGNNHDEETMRLLSTARMVFLSKTNSEIINNQNEYRTLAI